MKTSVLVNDTLRWREVVLDQTFDSDTIAKSVAENRAMSQLKHEEEINYDMFEARIAMLDGRGSSRAKSKA